MLTNKILLIDDDPEEFDILCGAVDQLDKGIGCVAATSCQEGFQKLTSSQGLPRYIFLDLNMPGWHGKYCLEKIKKHPVFNAIPVFIYTTSNRDSDKEETKKLGADRFITKPDSPQELRKILSSIVQ